MRPRVEKAHFKRKLGSRRVSILVVLGGFLLKGDVLAPVWGQAVVEEDDDLTTACDGALSADYSESLSGSGTTMVRTVASSTGCPSHVHYKINPNLARELASTQTIPAFPMLIDSAGGSTDLSGLPGHVGLFLNGVAVYSGFAGGADSAVDYATSAISLEGNTFDLCGGHSVSVGIYHYHNTPGCLQEQAMTHAGTSAGEHTPQLGWSYDGFPIYGQLGPDGVEMLMCGVEGAHATYCLDSCGGYEGELADVDDFKYRYYNTCGFDQLYYPYITNCYRGCCPTGVTCHDNMEACGSSATNAYTSAYIPEVVDYSFDEPYDTDMIDGDDSSIEGQRPPMDCSYYLGSAAAGTLTSDGEDDANNGDSGDGGDRGGGRNGGGDDDDGGGGDDDQDDSSAANGNLRPMLRSAQTLLSVAATVAAAGVAGGYNLGVRKVLSRE